MVMMQISRSELSYTTHRVNRLLLGVATSLLLLATTAQAEPVLVETVGYASDLKTGALLYSEHHRITVDGREYSDHQVEYRNPQGEIIATKTLDYSRSRYSPAFRLDDRRDGYVEGGEWVGNDYRLFFRRSAQDEMQSAVVKRSENELVTDAGFNHFMIDRIEALRAGEKLEIDLSVAERQTSYEFRGYQSAAPVISGRQAIQVTTEPNSRLIRLLVDPLLISFDAENLHLLAYEGTTNIRDAQGKRYVARILFPPEEFRITALPAEPVLTR